MSHSEKFRLSDADDRFMVRFTKHVNAFLSVPVISLIFLLAGINLALGVRFKYVINFIMAAVFAAAGIQEIFILRKFRRLHAIIMQMQEHIARIERDESRE